MKVLVIKTSSMGDVVHTLPALTDAVRFLPEIQFDWVVEESFQAIPQWHTHVRRVIPIAFRKWRKQGFKKHWPEIKAFFTALRAEHYDVIIDAQGLFKSAIFTRFAKGTLIAGYDFASARESWVSVFYQKRAHVPTSQHAVTRTRQLFAQILGYPAPEETPLYGIDPSQLPARQFEGDYLVFLHGTTWSNKHWPEVYWRQLSDIAAREHRTVYLPWGNEEEKQRAERLAQGLSNIHVLPRLSIPQITSVIFYAKGMVGMDTGLSHIAAACGTPTISLYGPTDPKKSGALGPHQRHLSATLSCAPCMKRACPLPQTSEVYPPCFAHWTPEKVFENLLEEMSTT